MKKLVTILATLAFALSLGAPVFAAPRAAQTQSTTAKSAKAKSGKQHRKQSKKSGKASKAAMKDAPSTTPQSK